MRRTVGAVLAFVGAFVLALSVLAQSFLAGHLLQTPLDASIQRTLEGSASLPGGDRPVRVTRVATVDAARSDGDVAAWRLLSCTVVTGRAPTPKCLSSRDSRGRLVEAVLDEVAADRRTGAAVNDPANLPPDAQPREGQVERWPADARKTAYRYWYQPAEVAVEMAYDRTEDVADLRCFVYVGDLADAGLTGRLTVWVEPVTGSIVRQAEDVAPMQGRPARLSVASTAESVEGLAQDARELRDRTHLLTHTLPLIGYAVGGLLLLGAVIAAFGGSGRLPWRRRERTSLSTDLV